MSFNRRRVSVTVRKSWHQWYMGSFSCSIRHLVPRYQSQDLASSKASEQDQITHGIRQKENAHPKREYATKSMKVHSRRRKRRRNQMKRWRGQKSTRRKRKARNIMKMGSGLGSWTVPISSDKIRMVMMVMTRHQAGSIVLQPSQTRIRAV